MNYSNVVFLSGKIVSTYLTPRKELKVKLSIARFIKDKETGEFKIKTDSKNEPMKNIVSIRFFNEDAESVNSRFRPGDFVNLTAFIQTVRNHYTCKSYIELWGLNMWAKGDVKTDVNSILLTGKIDSVSISSRGNRFVNLYTDVEKEVTAPNGVTRKQNFRSYTNFMLRSSDPEVHKGDWVTVRGYLTENVNDKEVQRRVNVTEFKIDMPANKKKEV